MAALLSLMTSKFSIWSPRFNRTEWPSIHWENNLVWIRWNSIFDSNNGKFQSLLLVDEQVFNFLTTGFHYDILKRRYGQVMVLCQQIVSPGKTDFRALWYVCCLICYEISIFSPESSMIGGPGKPCCQWMKNIVLHFIKFVLYERREICVNTVRWQSWQMLLGPGRDETYRRHSKVCCTENLPNSSDFEHFHKNWNCI